MGGRPTQVPRWAWGAAGGAIIQPPSGSASAGFPAGMKPPAMWLNFQFNALGAWVDFLRGPNVETWTRTAWGTSPATYDASSAVLLAVDTSTVDVTGLAYRYLLVGVETSGPTTTLRASRSGADWVRRTNIASAPGTPLALAYMQSSTRWLLADNTPAVYYCARDAGGATGPVGSGSGNWSDATLDADDGSGGGISNPVAFAHDPTAGTAVLLTISGALYSSDGATWTEYAGTSGTARSGNGMDVVWDGANFVFVTGSGQIYASPTADGTFAYKATLAGGVQTYRLAVGELGEILAYVAGDGDTEDIYRSTNSGTSWTTIEPTTGFSRISRVRYHGGTWIAAATVAPFLWVSSDATTWTRVRMPVSGTDLALKDVAWDGNGWMVVGNGWVLQCPRGADPTDATYIPDTTPATLADAAYLRGRRLSTTAPTDGQVLRWDNTAQEWEPATISGGSMPTASGADEIPLSTGAGTTYTARTIAAVRALLLGTFSDVLSGSGWSSSSATGGASASWASGPARLVLNCAPGSAGSCGVTHATKLPNRDEYSIAIRVRVDNGDNSSQTRIILACGQSATDCAQMALFTNGSIEVGATVASSYVYWNVATHAAIDATARTGGELWLRFDRRLGCIAWSYGINAGTSGDTPTKWTEVYSSTERHVAGADATARNGKKAANGLFVGIYAVTLSGVNLDVAVLAIKTGLPGGFGG